MTSKAQVRWNCQEILKIQEEVSESWKKLIKFSEFGKRKVVDASQPDGPHCQLHQDTVISYFHLSVFSQGKFKIWSGRAREKSENFKFKN